jgi:type II secretory pathway pseudopilin PulG
MPFQSWLKLVAASLALILCVAVVEAWRADRRDRTQLAAELSATKQLLAAADVRQRDRDTQLTQTLAALDAQKRANATPAQILREILKSVPLPAPITLQDNQASSTMAPTNPPLQGRTTVTPSPPNPAKSQTPAGIPPQQAAPFTNTQKPAPSGAFIPRADLEPLYNFTLDCQACQAKLSVAQNDLADEKAKTAALTKERDDALRIAKGGSAWRRVTRAAKWFLLGAAASAVIAKAR